MKYLFVIAIVVMVTSCSVFKKSSKTEEMSKDDIMNDEYTKVSYAIGVNIANNLQSQGIDSLDSEVVAQGLNDVFNDDSLAISNEEANALLQEYFQSIQSKRQEEANKEGAKYLEENAKRDGVEVLPSGLQFEVLEEGTGAKPQATDEVTVHYEGKLIDGKVFDSSYERGEPATFPLNQVIPGWTEGLQLMKEGATYMLYLPSNLAYGEQGAGEIIGPNETLIFKVELINVNKK